MLHINTEMHFTFMGIGKIKCGNQDEISMTVSDQYLLTPWRHMHILI